MEKTLKRKKNAFYKEKHDLVGPDLAAAINEAITIVTSTETNVALVGTGDFMDEADLNEKYKIIGKAMM